jgi:hypothetical protein
MKKECKYCEGYLEKGICCGDENGDVDKTGELKCFRLKNKLTLQDIESKIKDKKFTILEDGKTTICNIYLENGFTVRGESACVDVSNFNKEIGEEIAFKNAKEKIWLLEGYLLQEKLYQYKLRGDEDE